MKYFYNLLDGFKEPDRFYDDVIPGTDDLCYIDTIPAPGTEIL